MNIGVIGNRGAWSTELLSRQLASKNAGGTVIQLNEISYNLTTGHVSLHHQDLSEFDGFIIKKMGKNYSSILLDELELLELLERRGVRFFSSPSSIREMISRLSCTIRLRENNIPMPPTFVTEDIEDAVRWVEANAPVILKPLYSTKARGMELLVDADIAREHFTAMQARGEQIIYLQKKLELSGSDYGLVFLGSEYIGAYARVGDGSTWHTTTQEGGRYAAYTPTADLIDLATRAQAPFNLDFTCVDIAITEEVGPVVFEVSAFGSYKGLSKSSGLDASALLTNYVIEKLTDE
ncbi:MAG: ribosomal protein S6--L-glutamate ligase [Candidatus Azotimanducaceae bacterium]